MLSNCCQELIRMTSLGALSGTTVWEDIFENEVAEVF